MKEIIYKLRGILKGLKFMVGGNKIEGRHEDSPVLIDIPRP